jgi:uncharacterized RDD family membrane protein YckC
MSIDPDASMTLPGPQYARFSRRLCAIMLDSIITVTAIAVALLAVASIRNDDFSHVLGWAVVIMLLLYEPILVSATGGTLGHYFTNLRVVDDRDGGNVSFLKACARFIIKGLLGWPSFVVLSATRRNQAIHDLMTRSTVQIRDPAKASPGQYVTERSGLADPSMPPWWRRSAVIGGYLLLTYIAGGVAIFGSTSPRCLHNESSCSSGERIIGVVLSISMLFMTAGIIGVGWKGRLFGARKA